MEAGSSRRPTRLFEAVVRSWRSRFDEHRACVRRQQPGAHLLSAQAPERGRTLVIESIHELTSTVVARGRYGASGKRLRTVEATVFVTGNDVALEFYTPGANGGARVVVKLQPPGTVLRGSFRPKGSEKDFDIRLERVVRGSKLLRSAGLAQLQALARPPHTARRRDQSLALLAGLNAQIRELDDAITSAALAHPDASRLISHPGVGALTALTTIVVLGPVGRFHDSKHVVSYVGLAPAVNASADKYHLGHITKQGSTLLRFALGQAASHASRMDVDLKRTYFTLVHRRGRPKAKVAVARKLLVRLFIMLRDQIDYDEFRRRGRQPPAIAPA
jgi:hypothetical protein